MTVNGIREENYPSAPQILGIDRIAEAGMLGYKYTRKAVTILKSVSSVLDAYATVPDGLSNTLLAFKVIKIIKGILAVPEFCKNIVKVFKSGNAHDRFYGSWNIVKAVKKIVNAVETIFLYLSKLNLISKVVTAWTAVTGYIFMPVSFISAGISAYECGAKAKFMVDFRSELKAKKQTGVATASAIAARTCKNILAHKSKLKKFEVITNDCPLNKRLTNILKRLKSGKLETRLKAAEEGMYIKKRLKDRLREQVGIAAVGTSIATAGVASTVIGLACPPAAPALAIVGAVLTVVGLANAGYSKCVPQGDILDTEKRMLFASIRKGVKTAGKAIKASCITFRHEVQILAQKLFTPKTAAPAA